MLPQAYTDLQRELSGVLPAGRIIDDPLRRFAFGTDASFYRLDPKLVVVAEDEAEVVQILRLAHRYATPVTFRAAGTSLSGQAITDSVLVVQGEGWRGCRIEDEGRRVRLQPGIIGAEVNRRLAAFGRKIGPDPASINAARVGGIAANNASGMCCGVAQNSYQTLAGMRLILADGTLVDTNDAASVEAFRRSHAELLSGLAGLAARVAANPALAERIRTKFKIKNTTGYSLNALVDFADPVEILQHLLIGSEGTLGFIAEISYNTVPEHPHKASALVFFADIRSACEAVAALKPEPVSAVELMDRAAIHSVEDKPGMPDFLRGLPETAAALLIETRAPDPAELAAHQSRLVEVLGGFKTLQPVAFSADPAEYGRYWNIRKGLFPSVGAMRAAGTTVIIEDVAFAVADLAQATLDLQALFAKYGYSEAIIFGHALEGNLHFVFTQDFATTSEVRRYHEFMDEVCHMVVEKYDGSLKGEHSTGRNMAPYVKLEWGADAYALMREIKQLLDPGGLLNPGVILNDDAEVHVRNLKAMAAAHPLVDKCIECGFCEPQCPSRALTLTPRQRIALLREMARLEASGEDAVRLQRLRQDFRYQGVDTCAGDGLCATACPVGIDTGRMIKTLRGREAGWMAQALGGYASRHFGVVAGVSRGALAVADGVHAVLGADMLAAMSRGARKLSGQRLPLWNPAMPRKADWRRADQGSGGQRVVYFPSCASRNMGPARGDTETDSLPDKLQALLAKAGFEVVIPDDSEGLCCGMPFESKGLFEPADAKRDELLASLRRASRDGQDPILFDTSPCAQRTLAAASGLPVQDLTEFLHDAVLPRLRLVKREQQIALHATCSVRKMGLTDKLLALAQACAEEVIQPEGVTCCGWAGDKGFTQPELNASALRRLKSQLPSSCREGFSTSRTCEIGLSLHSERPYRSIVYLLDRCSEAVDAGRDG